MSVRTPRIRFLENLTSALLTGEWTPRALRRRARQATGESSRWIPSLVRRVMKEYPDKPDFALLGQFVSGDKGVLAACSSGPLRISTIFAAPSSMSAPPAAAGDVQLPQITTEGEMADWLGISVGKLLWLADTSARNSKHPEGPLRSYRYRWVAKSGGRWRLLEVPKASLKQIQRKILAEILHRMPVHPAAHGFCPGRSIVTNASMHCAKRVVLRFDLADFFPSVSATRVVRTFRTFGYPDRVARLFTGLCTNCIPYDVWQSRPSASSHELEHLRRVQLTSRHLPQGAPTSPAIANLAAFRLDRRLSKLADCLGADYTRYADDLTLSGNEEFGRGIKRINQLVNLIVEEEGFRLNQQKTRIMRRGQRQLVTGVVVNAKLNATRPSFDRLKAILVNCIRQGPASQNRDGRHDFRAHLSGRIAHMASINPIRARKLWVLFDRIVWNGESSPDRAAAL